MKKLLLILFIFPIFCFAQSPVTPSFKRKIPIDSLLGYSFPGITGTFWLPDTAWVKKHAGGNSSNKFDRNFRIAADSVHLADTIKKAPWFFVAPQLAGAIQLFQFRNSGQAMSAVGSAFTTQISTQSLNAIIGTIRHSDMTTAGLKVDTPGTVEFVMDITGKAPTIHRNYDISDGQSILTRSQSDSLYLGGGGTNLGNSDLTQTDPTRTFTIGTGSLVFTGTNGSDVNTTTIANNQFDSQITDGSTLSDIGNTALGGSIGTTDIASNNSSSLNSFGVAGGETGFSLQNVDGSSGFNRTIYSSIGPGSNPGIIIHDGKDHVALIGDEVFPISDDKQYAQYGKVDSLIAAAGSTLNFTNGLNQDGADVRLGGTLTDPTNIDVSNHFLDFTSDGVANGSILEHDINDFGVTTTATDTATRNRFISTITGSAVGIGLDNLDNINRSLAFNIDSAKGFQLLDDRFKQGIKYTHFANWLSLKDSSLVPRKYAIVLMDSVKATISGGTGTVTSITPGVGFLSHTPITTSGTMNIDTASTIAAKAYVNNFGTKAFNAATYQPLLGFTAENSVNKSNTTTLGTSTTLYPTQNAVKVYVDNSVSGITGFVPTSRTITVNGVSQDLSANRTYTITTANTDTTSTGFATRLLINNYLTKATAASTYALQTTTISAGNGLSGGGSLAANRTLSADTSVLRTVLNSYSLSGMATKLSNYGLLANPLSQFASTTSLQLLGVISDETGTGSLTFANTPTLVTPVLGVATATSINKVAITAPATSATLTIANGATLQQTGAFTLNLTATAASTPTFPTGSGTLPYLAGTNSWGGGNTFGGGLIVNTTQAMFNGGFNTSSTGGSNASNFFGVGGDTPSGNLTNAGMQLLGSTNLNARAVSNGQTTATMGAGNSSAVFVIGSSPITKAASGTHPLVAGLAVRAPVINSGSATVTNSATAFFAGSPTGATNNYTIYSIGVNRLDTLQTTQFKFGGSFGTSGQMPIINGSGALSWVTAYTGLITGTPTIVAGTGAGTSPTVSVTTNGKQLQVTVTTGTLPTGTNATIATVTLPNALSYTPLPVFSSASAATALLNGASMIYMTSTGTANVTITSGTTALTAATTYVWNIVL